jgi:uncharacterized damage-inducible protein DinB
MDFQKALIAEFDRETDKTRKFLEAIPADADFTYKPHPKSMSLGRLAGHIAETPGDWALSVLTTPGMEFPAGFKFEPYIPASKQAMLEKYDLQVATSKAALASFKPENWEEHWKFVSGGTAWVDDTKHRVFRDMILNHLIHHRAQLGVYLRLLNQPIPGTYGPSADES